MKDADTLPFAASTASLSEQFPPTGGASISQLPAFAGPSERSSTVIWAFEFIENKKNEWNPVGKFCNEKPKGFKLHIT